jgi:hypothetical protein
MHSNSIMKAVIAVVYAYHSPQPAALQKVAFADLPVLTQMALNIASLVTALHKAGEPERSSSDSEHFQGSGQGSESATGAL